MIFKTTFDFKEENKLKSNNDFKKTINAFPKIATTLKANTLRKCSDFKVTKIFKNTTTCKFIKFAFCKNVTCDLTEAADEPQDEKLASKSCRFDPLDRPP